MGHTKPTTRRPAERREPLTHLTPNIAVDAENPMNSEADVRRALTASAANAHLYN